MDGTSTFTQPFDFGSGTPSPFCQQWCVWPGTMSQLAPAASSKELGVVDGLERDRVQDARVEAHGTLQHEAPQASPNRPISAWAQPTSPAIAPGRVSVTHVEV